MSDYEQDFYAWTQEQAAALRARESKTLDWDHLAEEIESLGNEQRHAVRSHLRVVLWHLLKWAYQPDHRGPSWLTSIGTARAEIADRLEDYPSLRPRVPALLAPAYRQARRLAAAETGLPLATFPEACPWPLEHVLEDDFLPDAPASEPEDHESRPGPTPGRRGPGRLGPGRGPRRA